MDKNLGIGWQLHDRSGWGVYGINLALQLLINTRIKPVLLFPPVSLPNNPLQLSLLLPLLEKHRKLKESLDRQPEAICKCDFTVLHSIGNQFIFSRPGVFGKKRIGVIFFEDTFFDQKVRFRAKNFDLLVAGSTWNEQVLRDAGFNNVRKVLQGIDPTIFHPAQPSNYFPNRFVVFSGGKLEYRKGQDIVIAAFKAFHARHPEALLLASWHNPWPTTMAEIGMKGHVTGPPLLNKNQQPDFTNWLIENGLRPESFIIIPETPNVHMAAILREADVALFTNRAEGGTNLMAMECLASGLPTILSSNTGHLDFADENICFPLKVQHKVISTPAIKGVAGWGETDVEEAVEVLEGIYTQYSKARERAGAAVEKMKNFTWEKQIGNFVKTLEDVI